MDRGDRRDTLQDTGKLLESMGAILSSVARRGEECDIPVLGGPKGRAFSCTHPVSETETFASGAIECLVPRAV